MTNTIGITKAELARRLGVSRTYITYLTQGKKKPSREMADRLAKIGLTVDVGWLSTTCPSTHTGPLAQLAEQLTLNQPVGGSSPPRLTLKILNFANILPTYYSAYFGIRCNSKI
jgi:transcriptional regulator with XRE-family HTH domain